MIKKTVAALGTVAVLAACGVDTKPEPAPEPQPESVPRQAPATANADTVQETESVEPGAYDGMSGSDGVFSFTVAEAYIDDDGYITDGMGFSTHAPDGMDYWIFNVDITNDSDRPEYWDGFDNTATDTQGRTFNADFDAEFTVCDDYCGGDLNPGESVETDVIFLVPEGTSLASVRIGSGAIGSDPVELAP